LKHLYCAAKQETKYSTTINLYKWYIKTQMHLDKLTGLLGALSELDYLLRAPSGQLYEIPWSALSVGESAGLSNTHTLRDT
jgi:hypothetical protein